MKTILVKSFLLFALVGLLFVQCRKNPDPVAPKSSDKSLTTPTIDGVTSTTATYDAATYTHLITVPYGTDVTMMKVGFTLPEKSTVKPALGSVQNFTNPVSYTVTAEDGTTQIYIVKVVVAAPPKSSEKQITDFRFTGLSPVVSATVNQSTYKVDAIVLAGTSVTALTPAITVSSKATITPASGQAQNFTNPVSYTITAEDGTQQIYVVTLTRSVYYIDDADYSLRADVSGDRLILTSTSKKGISFSPYFQVDVNQNGRLDANLDRAYGISTSGIFCSQYLINYFTSTYCGGSPSTGMFTTNGNNIVFSIPLSELLPSDKNYVSMRVQMYNFATTTLQYYPGSPAVTDNDFFKNTFLIKVR